MIRPQPTHDSLKAEACRAATPASGWCYRCGFPWKFAEPHITNYTTSSGCFPLCEECWKLLGSPEARIEYYKILVDYWESRSEVSDDTKRDIQRAVANGL